MRLESVKQVASDVVEITADDRPVFFVREAFLQNLKIDDFAKGKEFFGEEEEEILQAALIFSAECKAEEYLARCEQCRFSLEKKLIQKNHSKSSVKIALDWLEAKGLLDDSRFCRSWLRSHVISKPQGRPRLVSELCSRGIKTFVAKQAVDEFLEIAEEEKLCKRCFIKATAMGKKDEKLIKYMIDSGFSYKMVSRFIDIKEN
ncbi:regulatory protein RecX [Treponema pectinovorum]|uniref:regulatory protein RecX n=1 Tax=Treponema pectinovorum TaxID=164 RepID=UPI0011CAB63B|nr:regulatory protein RecX [Treponema pectinovorum]